MKRLLVLSSLLLPFSLYAEKSAFGAGDLSSPSPYGLTPTEQYVLKNKNPTTPNKSRIDKLEETVSGVLSIVEGLNEKGPNDKLEFRGLKDSSANLNQKIDELVLKHDENLNQLKTDYGRT